LFENKKLDSSAPLKNFNNENISYDFFSCKIPLVKSMLLVIANEDSNDFDSIEGYLFEDDEYGYRNCQLRRFLLYTNNPLMVINY